MKEDDDKDDDTEHLAAAQVSFAPTNEIKAKQNVSINKRTVDYSRYIISNIQLS
jgi:hypothetical protein